LINLVILLDSPMPQPHCAPKNVKIKLQTILQIFLQTANMVGDY